MTTPPKPSPCPVRPANIPSEMKVRDQWVCWRWTLKRRENKPPKWDKPPLNSRTGELASSTDSTTWSAFDVAFAAYSDPSNRFDGIGYVFSGNIGDFVGVDLDHCRDRQSEVIQPWAAEQRACKHWSKTAPEPTQIIADLGTYAEVSPSGTGVKLICQGIIPSSFKHGDIEMYRDGRYFTVTGMRLVNSPSEIRECNSALAAIYPHFNVKPPPPVKKPKAAPRKPTSSTDSKHPDTPTPERIITACTNADNGQKFLRLFDGDAAGYMSQSEAELALCGIIAFWSAGDAGLIDAVFRQSKLLRDKWDEARGSEKYGQRTVRTALEGCTAFFDWTRQKTTEGHVIGNLRLVTTGVRKTTAKLTVSLEIQRENVPVDLLKVSDTVSSRRQAAHAIAAIMGDDAAESLKNRIEEVLGLILVNAQKETRPANMVGAQIHEILAGYIPGLVKFTYAANGGKAFSEGLQQEITRAMFVERYTNNTVLQLAATAADVPRGQDGEIKRPQLIAAVEKELRILWGDLTSPLGMMSDVDLPEDSQAATAFRQAIISLWVKPASMGIHRQEGPGGSAVQLATRNSLASRVLRMLAEDSYEGRAGWTKVHEGFDAYYRVVRGPAPGEIRTLLAMRYELATQIGVVVPGATDQNGLGLLGKKFGAIDPEPGVTDRMTGGGRLAVLSRSLCDHILAVPEVDVSVTPEEASDSEPDRASDTAPKPVSLESHQKTGPVTARAYGGCHSVTE